MIRCQLRFAPSWARTAITPISIDHVSFLGDTIAAIARREIDRLALRDGLGETLEDGVLDVQSRTRDTALAVVEQPRVERTLHGRIEIGVREDALVEVEGEGVNEGTFVVTAVPFPGEQGTPHGAVLTFSDSTASLNWMVVLPPAPPAACWYGISVPARITASFWFCVTIRGADTISPRPSACAADSSRSTT